MIRKVARQRREYLYRKSVQNEERERLDRKIRIREALEQGKPISEIDLQREAEEAEYGVQHSLLQNNSAKGEGETKTEILQDNEYALAGLNDPKILLTSAREPSNRLRRFLKELRFTFPNSQRINRGNQQLKDIVAAAKQNGFTDIVMIHETRGEPTGLIVSHLPYGPTASFTIYNTVMRHDTNAISEKISEAYPHLIFHNFKTKLGERVATILKYLYPVPKLDSKRIMTFSNESDFISFRHHVYHKDKGKIVLKEVGPRFELQLYEIKLGTLEQKDAETEWVLRPYMNTASKRNALGKSKEELLQLQGEEKHMMEE